MAAWHRSAEGMDRADQKPVGWSMAGSNVQTSVSNFIITLYAKLYQVVMETNLICDASNNKYIIVHS